MKINLKLNIGNFQNIDIESNFENKMDCYKQIHDVLIDWVDITSNAVKLRDHLALILRPYLESLDPDLEYPIEKLEVTEEVVKPKKLPKSKKKLDAVKHKVAGKPCRTCGGFISWDGYDKSDPTPPLHVNQEGIIMNDGNCPEWEAEQ